MDVVIIANVVELARVVPCSVTGKVIRAGKLSAYKELESCWYSRFFIKVFYPVRLVSLLGSQSWSPSEHRLQLLLLLAFLLQFLDKPSNVSAPAQNWVALFLLMLRTSLLDSTSIFVSKSMRLSTDLRQPMVRKATSLQHVFWDHLQPCDQAPRSVLPAMPLRG